ncbi:MAG: polysaccharide deacetylase family protein [Endozoicomonas sp. (ex Botrylloides leachii)]|nr:polysaccharide deacetylase family protein [Endozoicomonas sp. (ex Botrylloides leachii)]
MQKWRQHLAYLAIPFLQLLSTTAHAAQHAVILQYHHISDTTPKSTTVTPSVFSEHLKYLEDNNFKVLALTDVTRALQRGDYLPDKAVVITFDDAYRNIYDNAFPLLKKRGWPFTLFVSTDPVDKQYGDFLNWTQIKEMSNHDATIANHTLAHDHLVEKKQGETKEQWLDRVKKDLTTTEQRIKEKTGQSVKHLAWPFGETVPELRALITDLGYVGLGQQSGAAGTLSDFTLLPRYPMAASYANMKSFKLKVNSLPLPVIAKTPETMLIDQTNLKPTLTLTLKDGDYQKNQLRCYGRKGQLDITWLDDKKTAFAVTETTDLAVGRSRYNCTAPSNNGRRYYWYSHPWLQLTSEGKALN